MEDYPTDRLYDLIRAKRSCLRQLHEISRRQQDLIGTGDMPRLLDLLAVKQRMIDQLQRVERALDPFRAEPPEARRWRSEELRRQCAEEVRQCDQLLAELLAAEKRCEAELTRRRDEAAQRLQGVHRADHARQSYLEAPPDISVHLDIRSG